MSRDMLSHTQKKKRPRKVTEEILEFIKVAINYVTLSMFSKVKYSS